MRTSYDSFGVTDYQIIPQLAKDLFSKNYLLRKKAREELVEIGQPSLRVLKDLARSKDETARWEAIITIVQIGSDDTLNILLNALKDEEFSIRWLAAEGLVNLGKDAILPLLRELRINPESAYLRRGVHHVLKELKKKNIFKDNFGLIGQLANEYDHSSISTKVQYTINALSVS
jgi:HEAT repeat protein